VLKGTGDVHVNTRQVRIASQKEGIRCVEWAYEGSVCGLGAAIYL
jgi:hypothetical protein